MNNYGSEWRRWDLHVHTPESIVHEYRVYNSEDTWEKFIVSKHYKLRACNDK